MCANVKVCKYIFKYVHKNNNRINNRIQCEDDVNENNINLNLINEIQKYQNAR